MSEQEFEQTQMLQRNRLSNIAFGCMSIGCTTTLLIALGAAYGLHANSSSEGNNHAAVVIIGVATGVWIFCGTPWFFLEKDRAAKLPKGETYFSVGAKAYYNAFKRIPRLTQTWLYLLGYFLVSDGYATTNQLYGICQNTIVSYGTTTSTELYIVQGISNAFGIAVFWLIQRKYKIRTKLVLMVNCGFLLIMPIWGCIGIGTDRFGFHHVWEVWAFSVIDFAAVAPFYAFTTTMLSDICPKGREVTFFALYALVSKSTAWIGPIVSGVIIDRTGNTWKGFPFSLGLTVVGYACICMVDVEKGKKQCEVCFGGSDVDEGLRL
jgi:MFS-type transporter involved in bile tolerance (Atg22 family)